MQAFAIFESGTTELSNMDLPTTNPLGPESLLSVTRSGVCHQAPVISVVDAALHLAGVTHALNRLSTC